MKNISDKGRQKIRPIRGTFPEFQKQKFEPTEEKLYKILRREKFQTNRGTFLAYGGNCSGQIKWFQTRKDKFQTSTEKRIKIQI